MATTKEHDLYCGCGHTKKDHFQDADCMSAAGEYPCGCSGFVLDSYIEWIEVGCEHEISHYYRGMDCESVCDNPLTWKVTISKTDTPDAFLTTPECENCGYLWNDDSASDYRHMERYAIDMAQNDNPFDEDVEKYTYTPEVIKMDVGPGSDLSPDWPPKICIDCGDNFKGEGRLCNSCFKIVKL